MWKSVHGHTVSAWGGWGGGYHWGGGSANRELGSYMVSQWYGLVRGGGGGAGVCGEGWGPFELQREKRPGVRDKASTARKPYASHKSYNVAQ